MNYSNGLLVTTTNSIEGFPITEYMGIVTANVVMGINVLNDFVASFSDFFGGTSGKYSKEMNKAYDEAMSILEYDATSKKANAIVGIHIDFDEISGKGKSMLMVSISGTAVRIDLDAYKKRDDSSNHNITNEVLSRLYLIEKYRSELEDDSFRLNESDWSTILNNNLTELTPQLIKRYVKATLIQSPSLYQSNSLTIEKFPLLLEQTPYSKAVSCIYSSDWGDNPDEQKCYTKLIIKQHLFDAQKILDKLPKIDKHIAIDLLNADKYAYDIYDIPYMEGIVEYFDNLPDTGHYDEKKGNVFSKGGKIMVCEHGHKTLVDKSDYCQSEGCGLNIKGIREDECNTIERFKTIVMILDRELSKNKQ